MDLEFLHSLVQPAKTKIVLCSLDGLGGLPRPGSGKSELETARIPTLHGLAGRSACGLLRHVGPGITPGSGPGHLGLFGYDPLRYPVGRGVLEALGIDFELQPGDVVTVYTYEEALPRAENDVVLPDRMFGLDVLTVDLAPQVVADGLGSDRLVVVEEGTAHFDLASEIVARAVEGYRGAGRLRVRRISAQPRPIPSALPLELAVLPSAESLREVCLELYDE